MSLIHAAEVSSYTIQIGEGNRGSGDFRFSWKHHLNLRIEPGPFGRDVRSVDLIFLDHALLRVFFNPDRRLDSSMRIYVKPRLFESLYDMLRSEKPINLVWQERDRATETYGSIIGWRLTTSNEPIGEGPVDPQ